MCCASPQSVVQYNRNIIVIIPKIIIAIIVIPIIFDVTERPVGAPLSHIYQPVKLSLLSA